MQSLVYSHWSSYPIIFLVSQLRKDEIKKEYLSSGIPEDDVKCLKLFFQGKKTPVGVMKSFIQEELLQHLDGAKYLVVTDAGYFKTLTGQGAEASLGYVQDCLYGPWKVVYVPSTRAIFYDPEKTRAKIQQGLEALLAHIQGTYQEPGEGIIQFEAYPETPEDIEAWLNRLLEMNCDLAIDIEAFSLKHYEAGIGTISFAWDKHAGVAFPVDYVPVEGPRREAGETLPYGIRRDNPKVRSLLKDFFLKFKRKAYYFNAGYDVYNLIYQLFMKDLLDTPGLLEGLEVMFANWEDAQLVTYLATNTCAGNELGLKPNAQEFAGDYAEDVQDITKVPLPKLLRYNLVDALSTWYVNNKNYPKMVLDQQLDIYTNIFKPSLVDIVHMQLTGMPVNMERVREVKLTLEKDQNTALETLSNSPIIKEFTLKLNQRWVEKRNSKLKKKRVSLEDADERFNPNSNLQLQDLLFSMLKYPVIDLTDSKQPSTSGKTLEALLNHAQSQEEKDLLQALLDYSAVNKILTSFIPALESAPQGPDGWHYLFGSFRLGGTVSGRLSSANPNLQNLPANSKYAGLIKSCFMPPPGWLYVGLDFDSLEDRISALTTKDPNKLKVYIDGYDGHSLRAFYYYREEFPDIVDTVESINSIRELYPDHRQESKAPTFALTYQGTYLTLMKNCGFSEEKAKQIEARYHEMYEVSDSWIQEKLNQAEKDGYVTGAFGLRVRTPLLPQVVHGTSKTPYEAEAERRTAGNALGQSWCLLNNRAASEFMGKVRKSSQKYNIKPCAHIHDSQYYMIRDDIETVLYVNEHLVKAVRWQDHPVIAHDQVHLGGSLSIYWPTWAKEIRIPNEVGEEGLLSAIKKGLNSGNY